MDLIITKDLAFDLIDNLTKVYLSALSSQKKKLNDDDIRLAMNYARSKYVGIMAEFEYNDCEWHYVDDEE